MTGWGQDFDQLAGQIVRAGVGHEHAGAGAWTQR